MKKLLLLTFILAACSSAPKTESSNYNPLSDEYAEMDGDSPAQVDNSTSRPLPPADPNVSHDQLRKAVESNNTKKVEEIAAQLLARNPRDTRALNALGVQHLKDNKPTIARMIFKKALDVEPNNSAITNNYGLTFLAEKEEGRAMLEFKKALEMDSKNAAAAANLGAIHVKARNYGEARRLLDIAYYKNKSNTKVANNFAISLRGTGDFSAARRVYENAVSSDSRDFVLMLNYAILLVENLNDKTKGREVINKIKFLASDPAILERVEQLEAKIK